MTLLFLLSIIAATSMIAQAQEARGATLVLSPTEFQVEVAEDFVVEVIVEDVEDLGAFQFYFAFDPDVVTVDNVKLGDFLGSTNRQVTAAPWVETEPGKLTYGAFSLGAESGPSGRGVLAEISITAKTDGESTLALPMMSGVRLIDTAGRGFPLLTTIGATVFVGSAQPGSPTPTKTPLAITPVDTPAPTSTPTADATDTPTPVSIMPTTTATTEEETPVFAMTKTLTPTRELGGTAPASPTATATEEASASSAPTATSVVVATATPTTVAAQPTSSPTATERAVGATTTSETLDTPTPPAVATSATASASTVAEAVTPVTLPQGTHSTTPEDGSSSKTWLLILGLALLLGAALLIGYVLWWYKYRSEHQ
jgi:hypothetical protein